MDYKEKVIALLKSQELSKEQKEKLENIFLELQESEEERVKKAIIESLPKYGYLPQTTIKVEDAIAWLKKQGKQKPVDKIEPKFKVGDWVVYTGYLLKDSGKEIYVMKVASVEDDSYNFTDTSILCFDSEKDMRLWTIQDAKEGDVLQLGGVTAIFQKYIGNGNCKCYCSVYNGELEIPSQDGTDNSYGCCNAIPATKEQRDLLFQKMKEAGYEWDAEKKELKKIEQKSQRMISAEAKEAMYDKPAWSEEDEEHIDSLLKRLDGLCRNEFERTRFAINEDKDWLESLKQRIEGE